MSCQEKTGFARAVHPVHELTPSVKSILGKLGIDYSPSSHLVESLPFSLHDTTAGTENELQVAVRGERDAEWARYERPIRRF